MKEVILVYGQDCLDSKKSFNLIKALLEDKNEILIHWVPFSFQSPLIKKYSVMITPTFIIDDKIAFVGTPEKEQLIEKLKF
jgi:hypothetical protein